MSRQIISKIRELARKGEGGKCIELFPQVKTARRQDHVDIITALISKKQVISAEKWVGLMTSASSSREPPPHSQCYALLARAHAEEGNSSKVMELINHCASIEQYNAILKVIAGKGNAALAESVYQSIQAKKLTPTIDTHNYLIRSHANNADLDSSLRHLDGMMKPNIQSFQSVLHACSKKGDIRIAEGIITRMKLQSMKLDIPCYSSIISAAAKSNDLDKAISYLNQMKKEELTPDRMCYGGVLRGYAQQGDSSKALKLLETMQVNRK